MAADADRRRFAEKVSDKVRPLTAGAAQASSIVNKVHPSRERLIAAASKFFLNGSYHSVGTAEICAEASVNKGSFYHFFPSKTDLLIEVIEVRVRAVEQMIAAIAASDLQPARKILQLFDLPVSAGTGDVAPASASGFFLAISFLNLPL